MLVMLTSQVGVSLGLYTSVISAVSRLCYLSLTQPGYWGIFRYKYTKHKQPARPSTLIIRYKDKTMALLSF